MHTQPMSSAGSVGRAPLPLHTCGSGRLLCLLQRQACSASYADLRASRWVIYMTYNVWSRFRTLMGRGGCCSVTLARVKPYLLRCLKQPLAFDAGLPAIGRQAHGAGQRCMSQRQ